MNSKINVNGVGGTAKISGNHGVSEGRAKSGETYKSSSA